MERMTDDDAFAEWNGTFWTGYEPFESTPVVSSQRQLERASVLGAGITRIWPTSPADTRTPAQRQLWARAAHLVEAQVSIPPMATIASNLRRPRGHQRVAAVIEQRFHVPAAVFDANEGHQGP
jgi:hypothetical protein